MTGLIVLSLSFMIVFISPILPSFIPRTKGRDSTRPVLGTAKRPSRKHAKPRRVAAWFLEELGKISGFRTAL